VRVDGNPSPSVSWIKNGVELAIDGCRYSVEAVGKDEGHWSLVISDCGDSENAEYGCTAVNELGQITSRCHLDVTDSS